MSEFGTGTVLSSAASLEQGFVHSSLLRVRDEVSTFNTRLMKLSFCAFLNEEGEVSVVLRTNIFLPKDWISYTII